MELVGPQFRRNTPKSAEYDTIWLGHYLLSSSGHAICQLKSNMALLLKRARGQSTADIGEAAGENTLSLLTAVKVVGRAHTQLAGIAHAVQSINGILDCVMDNWTLESVQTNAPGVALEEASAVRLLVRLVAHEWSGFDDQFRRQRFLCNVECAGPNTNLLVLDW